MLPLDPEDKPVEEVENTKEGESEDSLDNPNENCALWNSMTWCPEHCCDWDNCECSDCQHWQGIAHHDLGRFAPNKMLKSTPGDAYDHSKKNPKLK